MDVKFINPFLSSVTNIMPMFGISDIKKKNISIKGKTLSSNGIMIILGIIGDVKGNVVYSTDIESAKKIASMMMMGAPVTEFDELAQSAISELTNMLTANAATEFSNMGVSINISTPTMMYGNAIEAKVSTDKVICVELLLNDIPFEINVSVEVCN